jgi:hypothetical protein
VPNGIAVGMEGASLPSLSGSGSAAFSAYSLNFGSAIVGASAQSQLVAITNQGIAPLTISAAAAATTAPAGASDFSVQIAECPPAYRGYCYYTPFASPIEIEPQRSQSFLVGFAPSQIGAETGTISFTDTGSAAAQVVYVSGRGISAPPTLAINPSTLAFLPQPLGDPSAPQTFYLGNTGDGEIIIDRALASGDFQIDTQASTCEAATLGACSLAVSFVPTAVGARNGSVTLIDSLGNPQTFNLAGTGVAATGALTVSQASVAFPAQAQGTTSATIPLVIANPGNSPVTVNSIVASGDFGTESQYGYGQNNCAAVLAPLATCAFDVTLTPTIASGNDTGTLSIKSTAGTQTVALSGTALAADTAIEVTPAKILFPAVQVGSLVGGNNNYVIYLENTGNQNVTFPALPTIAGVSPTPGADFAVNVGTGAVKMASTTIATNFTVTSDGCSGKTIGPASANYSNSPNSCAITVASTPLASAPLGFLRGTLTINDAAGAQQVALESYVLSAAQMLALSQTTASFGSVEIGGASPSQVVYLVDRGPASNGASPDRAQINSIAMGGSNPGDFVETQNCGGTLGFTIVGRTVCEFTIDFAPGTGALGTRSATLTITPANEPALVLQLVGQATPPASKSAKASGASEIAPAKDESSPAILR